MFSRILTATAFAAIASTAALADSRSIEIDYDVAAMSDAAAREALYAEIQGAARYVCDARSARTLVEVRIARQCVAEAVEGAMDQLNTTLAARNIETRTATVEVR